jgi:uncharacterized protein YndB with AHSA1/START domain
MNVAQGKFPAGIAPVVRRVTVKASPERAFQLFARQMGRWWPTGQTIGKSPHVEIVIEPRAGGRWFERDAQGAETEWGKVLAWEPPARLLLGWQLNSRFAYDPELLTEVELTFAPAASRGATVTLEHRNLERFGDDAEKLAGQLGSGWPKHLGEFAAYADANS